MIKAILHDKSAIDVEIQGSGPTLLLPVNPIPHEGARADELRRWGVDPALGRSLMDGLRDKFRVAAFDYEGHVLSKPMPDTLTPANIVGDLLAVADAAEASRFAYYGYSWLALSGLQLAIRTDRLSALIMGGYPPIDGPYEAMLKVTMATHELSRAAKVTPTSQQESVPQPGEDFDWDTVEVTLEEPQTRQFVTLYQALRGFDDRAAQAQLKIPRLCFAGAADEIDYGERWGNVHISIAGPLINRRAELKSLGWDVRLLEGMDHTQAMQPVNVLPIIRPWLIAALGV